MKFVLCSMNDPFPHAAVSCVHLCVGGIADSMYVRIFASESRNTKQLVSYTFAVDC